MKLFESLWQKRSRPRETGWHRSCSNLLRTTAQSHELEKRFSLQFCTFRDVYGHFHISTLIKVYLMERKKVGKHTACDALFALLLLHDNNKAARNNMPLEGPGTGLSNPNIYWDPVSAKSRIFKLHWIYIVWLGLTAAKQAEDKERHHSPRLYNWGTRPHFEVFQDRPLCPLLRIY